MKAHIILLVLIAILSISHSNGQESMLCQGKHWTEDEAVLKMKNFASKWDDKASWENRKGIILEGILQGMQWDKMPKLSTNLNVIIHDKKVLDGYSVENFAIESFPGFYVTGNIYKPLNMKSKNPAVLCPHGHMQDKRLKADVQIRSAMLAKMGAVVMAYDMVGHAESTQIDHKNPIALVLQTYNSKRIVDYLYSLDYIDKERIGMTGGSGGGTQTFILTAIDDRIKVSAPAVQVSAHFFGGCVCESGMPIHKSPMHQTNNVEVAALCAPRPLLLISNGYDWTRNTPRIEYPYIKSVYAVYDAEHRAEHVHLADEKHDYGPNKRAAMYAFMSHHLGLDYSDLFIGPKIDEGSVKILEPKKLKVFTKDYPRPANALKGDEAVITYLGIEIQ